VNCACILLVGLVIATSFPSEAHAQTRSSLDGFQFQIGGFIDYTTSTRIYTNSRDQDPSISSSSNSLGGIVSGGIDLRFILTTADAIGFTFQPLNRKQEIYTIYGYNSYGNYFGVPVTDGFTLYTLELNGYFRLPVVSGKWSIYLGGGPAIYVGKRNLQIGDAKALTPLVTSLGIQVTAGVAYRLTDQIGIRGEMKFRSPELNTTSTFNSVSTTYNGLEMMLPKTQYGKIKLDGEDFTVGIFWELGV
jgi:opacity protein-like surface antigen